MNDSFLELLEQSKSIETTIKVTNEVHESTSILATDPEIYKLDGLRKGNRGIIRAYEKHSYRISYQIEKETIYIIRVRDARREPLGY